MWWLRWVGSWKLQVSFAKDPYRRDDILQKRHIILRGLLIEATTYSYVTPYKATRPIRDSTHTGNRNSTHTGKRNGSHMGKCDSTLTGKKNTSCTCVTRLICPIHTCDMAHSHVTWLIQLWLEPFLKNLSHVNMWWLRLVGSLKL